MSFYEETVQAFMQETGGDPANFGAAGRPGRGQPWDILYNEFYETVKPAPVDPTLNGLNFTVKLWDTASPSGLKNNGIFPLPSGRVMYAKRLLCYALFDFDPALLAPGAGTLDGQSLESAIWIALASTNLTVNVDQKDYLNTSLLSFANVQRPAFVDSILGEFAPAPVGVPASNWQQHHRVVLPFDPQLEIPPIAQVKWQLTCNVNAFWTELTGAAPDPTKAPFNIKIFPTFRFTLLHNIVRNTK